VGTISVADRPGIVVAVCDELRKIDTNVLYTVESIDLSNNTDIVFCAASKDLSQALGLLGLVRGKFGGQEPAHNAGPVVYSVFGLDLKERAGIAGVTCTTLAKTKKNILFLGTSTWSISCVTDKDHLADAVEAQKDTIEFHDHQNAAVQ
jgi:aspartokinase